MQPTWETQNLLKQKSQSLHSVQWVYKILSKRPRQLTVTGDEHHDHQLKTSLRGSGNNSCDAVGFYFEQVLKRLHHLSKPKSPVQQAMKGVKHGFHMGNNH